jgi:hypothetical protein
LIGIAGKLLSADGELIVVVKNLPEEKKALAKTLGLMAGLKVKSELQPVDIEDKSFEKIVFERLAKI